MADQTKLITLGNLSTYDEKIKAYLATEDAKSLHTVLLDSPNGTINFYKKENAVLGTDTPDFTVSIPANLDGSATIASVSEGVVTLKAGISEVDGIVSNNSGSDITLAKVATTGTAADVAIVDSGSLITATNVEDALQELATASSGGVASKTVYITETAGSSSDLYSKRYGIYQGSTGSSASPVVGEKLADIDIPKDMVVEDGSIVDVVFVAADNSLHEGSASGTDVTAEIKGTGTATSADAGKYIKLTIANATSSHLWIKASDLVDIYTAQQNATQVQLAIDANNEISATIVAGSIDTTELANGAVETAKIADDAVTTAKILDANVTTAKIADSNVTTAKIADANVTTAKIADDAVTADKVAISAHTESQTAGSDGVAISVTTTDGQVSSVSASIAANTYEAYGAVSTAIGNLDATESQIAGADGLALSITEVDGVITGISGSIAAGTYLDTATYTTATTSDINALFPTA